MSRIHAPTHRIVYPLIRSSVISETKQVRVHMAGKINLGMTDDIPNMCSAVQRAMSS